MKPKRPTKRVEEPGPVAEASAHVYGQRLRASIQRAGRGGSVVSLPARREGSRIREEMEQVAAQAKQGLLGSGSDAPLHPAAAVYFYVHNQVSILVEVLINAPELEELAERLEAAQDAYMPSFPPMSPVTNSHFQCWAFYDAALGKARETFGTCILDLADELRLGPEFIHLLSRLSASRLGLHVHEGTDGPLVVLRELVTGQRRRCLNTSGYAGRAGELWLSRVLPPPREDLDLSINFTTPYVLLRPGEAKWLAYLDRALPKVAGSDQAARYEALMKYGLSDDTWNEYIFEAYASYDPGAVFLEGLPDVPSSRPHSTESADGGFRPLR